MLNLGTDHDRTTHDRFKTTMKSIHNNKSPKLPPIFNLDAVNKLSKVGMQTSKEFLVKNQNYNELIQRIYDQKAEIESRSKDSSSVLGLPPSAVISPLNMHGLKKIQFPEY